MLVAFTAYSWLASAPSPFQRWNAVSVALPIAVAAVLAIRSWRRHDTHVRSRAAHRARFGGIHRRALLSWSSLAALLVAWEVHELTAGPRWAYPTVSSLVTTAASERPVHALAFLAWLVLGWRLIEPREAE